MNTKAIIAGTIFTAVLAGTSASAQDNDYLTTATDTTTTQPFVIKHAYLLTTTVEAETVDLTIESGK